MSEGASIGQYGIGGALRLAAGLWGCLWLAGCPAFGYGDGLASGSSSSPSSDGSPDGSELFGDADVAEAGELDGAAGLDAQAQDATTVTTDGQADADAMTLLDAGKPDAVASEGGLEASTLPDASMLDGGLPDATLDADLLDAGDGATPDADTDAGDAGDADASPDAATDGGDVDGGDAAPGCAGPCDYGEVCEAGVCTPVSCLPGFDECDGNADVQCETSSSDDPDNCGDCGVVCPDTAGEPVCVAGSCDTRCDLTGTFALKLTLQTTWNATAEIAADTGSFDFWMRVRGTHVGNNVSATIHECGETVPPMYAFRSGDDILSYYRDSIFDAASIPEVPASFTLGDSSPDSSLAMPTIASQLGVSLADPLNDPWPSSPSGVLPSAVDHDEDGNPGVTSLYTNANPYIYPRTSANLLFFNRAQAIYIGARRTFSLNGFLTSCTQASGSVTFGRLDSHILGCVRSNGNPCSAAEASFLDTNAPEYTPVAGSYVLKKIADDADCAAVRAELP